MAEQPAFADEVRGPWATSQGVLLDVGVVVVGLLVAAIGTVTSGTAGGRLQVVAPLVFLQIVPLLLRRIRPDWCLWLVTGFSLLQLPLVGSPTWGQLAVPLTIYAAVTYGGAALGRIALGIGLVGAVVGPIVWTIRYRDIGSFGATVVICGLVVVTSWLVGTLGRTRRAYVEQLIERGVRLERETAQRAELAASDERARIAREMHDVVAHGLSVIVVQADGARLQLDRDPERVGRALDTIAATGRESLQEMRRLLGVLRAPADEVDTRPQPGLADVAMLLEQEGEAVESHGLDDLPDVPQGVGLTAYRIVQEALTNVRKHAGPGVHVRAEVWADGGWLHVVVVDDGRGASAPSDGEGHGLVGMRERIAVHGGTLVAAPRTGGGFEVRAAVPLAVVPTAPGAR